MCSTYMVKAIVLRSHTTANKELGLCIHRQTDGNRSVLGLVPTAPSRRTPAASVSEGPPCLASLGAGLRKFKHLPVSHPKLLPNPMHPLIAIHRRRRQIRFLTRESLCGSRYKSATYQMSMKPAFHVRPWAGLRGESLIDSTLSSVNLGFTKTCRS